MENNRSKELILVSAGNYSDYRVQGIFSTPEKADGFKKKFPGEDWNDNKPIILDRESIVPVDGHGVYLVSMFKNGDMNIVERQGMTLFTTERAHEKNFFFSNRAWKGK